MKYLLLCAHMCVYACVLVCACMYVYIGMYIICLCQRVTWLICIFKFGLRVLIGQKKLNFSVLAFLLIQYIFLLLTLQFEDCTGSLVKTRPIIIVWLLAHPVSVMSVNSLDVGNIWLSECHILEGSFKFTAKTGFVLPCTD